MKNKRTSIITIATLVVLSLITMVWQSPEQAVVSVFGIYITFFMTGFTILHALGWHTRSRIEVIMLSIIVAMTSNVLMLFVASSLFAMPINRTTILIINGTISAIGTIRYILAR